MDERRKAYAWERTDEEHRRDSADYECYDEVAYDACDEHGRHPDHGQDRIQTDVILIIEL